MQCVWPCLSPELNVLAVLQGDPQYKLGSQYSCPFTILVTAISRGAKRAVPHSHSHRVRELPALIDLGPYYTVLSASFYLSLHYRARHRSLALLRRRIILNHHSLWLTSILLAQRHPLAAFRPNLPTQASPLHPRRILSRRSPHLTHSRIYNLRQTVTSTRPVPRSRRKSSSS